MLRKLLIITCVVICCSVIGYSQPACTMLVVARRIRVPTVI